jgi:dethiobiotin synthetase
MDYFITGIDTDSGKTLTSAILCEALQADYWKPVQAGSPTDSEVVRKLVTNQKTKVHPETFLLKMAASPHAAAKHQGISIKLTDFIVPDTTNTLVIEGAGGCLVPLNDNDLVIDLAEKLDSEIVLVADLYLGSINHTLLSFNELRRRKLNVKGIVFNGESNPESESIIIRHTGLRCLLEIRPEDNLNKDVVARYADKLLKNWHE